MIYRPDETFQNLLWILYLQIELDIYQKSHGHTPSASRDSKTQSNYLPVNQLTLMFERSLAQ